MGKTKDLFLQVREDFEREAQKDELYLLEQLAEAEKTTLHQLLELPDEEVPGTAKVVIGDPKTKSDERPFDPDYALPF